MAASERHQHTSAVRWLRLHGMTPGAAGNLVGLRDGLHPVRDGWTLRELERCEFLRWLWETHPETRG